MGKRISELRKAKGLTQEELAEQCKISARTLQRIESGVVAPRAYTVRVIFAALKDDRSFMRLHFEHVRNNLKDLFNLKINTMKKVSILSAAIVATGIGLFVLCPQSKAQKIGSESYLPSRGIVYQISRDAGDIFISNTKDTALYRFGKYRIQEYNKQIFLDGEFVDFVEEGDTVILNKGTLFEKAKLEFRRVEYKTILVHKGITFRSPNHLPYTLSMKIGGGEARWKSGGSDINRILLNEGNQIFLNDVYQGDVFTNDTVILKPNGKLIIKNANRIEK